MDASHNGDGRVSIDVIDIHDDYHVRQWTEILDITADQLAAAVRAVGTAASKVKRYVRDRNLPSASAQDTPAIGHLYRRWWDS